MQHLHHRCRSLSDKLVRFGFTDMWFAIACVMEGDNSNTDPTTLILRGRFSRAEITQKRRHIKGWGWIFARLWFAFVKSDNFFTIELAQQMSRLTGTPAVAKPQRWYWHCNTHLVPSTKVVCQTKQQRVPVTYVKKKKKKQETKGGKRVVALTVEVTLWLSEVNRIYWYGWPIVK